MNLLAGVLAVCHFVAHAVAQVPKEYWPDLLKAFCEYFKRQSTLADLVVFVFLVIFTFSQ